MLADPNDHMRIDRGRALQGQSQSSLHGKAHAAASPGRRAAAESAQRVTQHQRLCVVQYRCSMISALNAVNAPLPALNVTST